MAVSAQGDLEGDGCAGGPPGLGDTPVQGDSDEGPGVAGLGLDTEDPEGQSPPGNLPSSPNIGEVPLFYSPSGRNWVSTDRLGGRSARCRAWLWPGPGSEQLGVSLRCVRESSALPPRTPRLREVT